MTKKQLDEEFAELERAGKKPFGGGEPKMTVEFDTSVINGFASREQLDKDIEEILVPGIKEYVDNARAKGVIIGISGGIDSAVVAALAVKALGDFWVKGVYMPCQADLDTPYSAEEMQDRADAYALADWLGIEISTLDFTTPFIVFRHRANLANGTATGRQGEISNFASSNMKARMRMVALYAMKEDMNYLCIGTGNKTELMIGYLTKYGDGGVDFEPLGDYYKTEVRIMADILGINDAVPNISAKSPSARLTPGQTDEGDLGMTYEELDKILCSLSVEPGGIRLKNWVEFDEHMVQKVLGMINRSEHKRFAPPTIGRS